MSLRLLTLSFVLIATNLVAGQAATRLVATPAKLTLEGRGSSSRVLLERITSDGSSRAVPSDRRSWKVVPEDLVRVGKDGRVHAVLDGTGTLVFEHDGQRVTVPVKVNRSAETVPVSYRNEVLPILTRFDCNSGGCHGAAAGKNGFALSLFGYDPDRDHRVLTRELRGRRVDAANPARSLMLTKPTGQAPHEGGRPLEPDGPAHRTLLRWIHEGARDDASEAPKLAKLELHPGQIVFDAPGQIAPLLVLAHFEDGRIRDVTEHTILAIDDPTTAKLEGDRLTAMGPGTATLLARYGGQAEIASVMLVPADRAAPPAPATPARSRLDEIVEARLKTLRLPMAAPADDGTFFRRLHLDLTNRLPDAATTRRFLADPDPNKRDRWIEKLTRSDAYAEVLTLAFAEVLRIEEDRLEDKGVIRFTEWLGGKMKENVPFDRVARDLLVATGPHFENPASSFWLVERDPKALAEFAAQVFLGVRIQCAQCHDHPFERWTMDDYYGFTSFFTRTSAKRAENPREQIVLTRGSGDVRHPVTNAIARPRLLGEDGETPVARGQDRRAVLAKWMTEDATSGFAEHLGNRLFARFFGRGVVEPVDDVRISNPPSHPELYAWLGERLRAHRFDLKAFTAELLKTRTYQQDVQRDGPPAELFAGAPLRRLGAEGLLEAIDTVTDIPTRFRGRPAFERATTVPGAAEGVRFLEVFGRSGRETACTCERRDEPTLSQALHLINGSTLETKIVSKDGRLSRLIASGATDGAILDELWLSAYCRYPREEERRRILEVLSSAEDRQAALIDVFWAVLNSREFLFQH